MNTPQQNPPSQNKPSWPGASLALFILGLCILVPAGLCTGTAIVIYPPAILVFLMLGGVPMAIGAALIWGALKARQAAVGTIPTPVPAQPSAAPDRGVNVILLSIGLLIFGGAGFMTVYGLVWMFTNSIDQEGALGFLVNVMLWLPSVGALIFGAWLIRAALPHRRS